MIMDIQRFVEQEKPYWNEFEALLSLVEERPRRLLSVEQIRRFHHLYERTSADMVKLSTFSSERELRRYLETLISRAYSEIHDVKSARLRFNPIKWFLVTLPSTVRKHAAALQLSVAITIVGCLFGGLAVYLDPDAKQSLLPFPHLIMDPSQRVAMEEKVTHDRLIGVKAQMTAWYITHNTQVSFTTFGFGVLWGVGTVLLLFLNGALLGAVVIDYIRAGQTAFLTGWLLPHGATEIPAIVMAGQAGLILAAAIIGRASAVPLRERVRAILPDLVTILGGVVLMLIWAGIVEANFSQYHAPVIRYDFKIALGVAELVIVFVFFAFAGKRPSQETGTIKASPS